MNRSQKTRWAKLAALTVAVALSACGGSDEAPVARQAEASDRAPASTARRRSASLTTLHWHTIT